MTLPLPLTQWRAWKCNQGRLPEMSKRQQGGTGRVSYVDNTEGTKTKCHKGVWLFQEQRGAGVARGETV